ncbi:hypothetical protein CR205_06085 [Alteribacter lacisalsi]|jgi:hypothetical protein|uniref:Uncharacterized protein n=1 Tax=Alteribacter lacisalsi TaxID=2045244 RepID=A0A2W0HM76_9BACI|nr:hypothetical protein [Alteribacter lacisalsi]PYZ98162.1 hypothetical protein CR205_06085 [Alteribacter lacisalsi]
MTWLALVAKEVRQNMFLMGLHGGLLAAALIIIWYNGDRSAGIGALLLIGVPLIIAHVISVFLYILASMRREWKDRTAYIWMNLPHSGITILSAKFAAAFLAGASFLFLTMLLILGLINHLEPLLAAAGLDILVQLYKDYAVWMYTFILYGAVQIGLAGLFIYVLHKVIRPLGWLIGIVITFGANWLWSFITDTAVYSTIAYRLPMLTIENVPEGVMVEIAGVHSSYNAYDQIIEMAYLGHTIIEVVLMAVIFLAICLLFDKKAEI